jgi:hypothetical protein
MKPINLLILLVRFSTILVTVDKKFCIIRFGIFPFMHRSLYLFLSRTLWTSLNSPAQPHMRRRKKGIRRGLRSVYRRWDCDKTVPTSQQEPPCHQSMKCSYRSYTLQFVTVWQTCCFLTKHDMSADFLSPFTLSLSLLNRWALKTSLYACHYCGCYITCLYSEHRFLQL